MSFNPQITIYGHYSATKEPKYITVSQALDRVRKGRVKPAIDAIRAEQDPDRKGELKKQLPGYVFSGRCAERADVNMLDYSGLLVLDFDKVDLSFRKEIEASEYTFACWLSPSGNGFKVLIRIQEPSNIGQHFAHIHKNLWPQVDASGKNASRLCFDSYDPDLYHNPEATVYSKILVEEKITWTERKEINGSPFDKLIRWLDKRGDAYGNGSRNIYVFKLSCACAEFGMDQNETVNAIGTQWPCTSSFPLRELVQTVRSAYKRVGARFGTASFQNDRLISRSTQKEIDLEELPTDGKVMDVHYAKDSLEEGLSLKNNGFEKAMEWGCPELDFKPFPGQLNILSGFGNVGKSSLMDFMQLGYSLQHDIKWAVFGPETYPAALYFHEKIEMLEGTGIYPGSGHNVTDEQYAYWNNWLHDHMYYIYPEENPTLEKILNRFLQLFIMEGVKAFVIDPYNQLSPDYTDTARDDRMLQRDLNLCKRFAEQNDVYFFILTHPKNPVLLKGEQNYRCPEYSDLAGGAMWANVSHNILMYHRPEFLSNPDATLCEVRKKKIKKPYATGKRGTVEFDYDYRRRRFMFGDRDPLGDLLRERFEISAPIVLPPSEPSFLPDRPNAGISQDYSRIMQPSLKIDLPDDFWQED